ncbi:MAG: 50S ribosomal protein L13 [Bacteroidia bacterium]|nr:50S ribosomal protein L13 [Bacteroidia bacterium]MBP7261103.1 50S ribosomal protein L13 [Bacteroidia bacterium]MBP9180242.1 50S ribosomal protein L13 [Bacteroidia bacterium]MBP9724355.1 50S ribosomal protein L13 [Bacteroidia bacterium]
MDTLSYKTISANKTTVDKKWLVVDAEGQTLGRFASKLANILRGKHKPGFTPHVDCGDNVIVINAEKIRFTGKKLETKEYVFYSGFPGGQRFESAKNLLARRPTYVVEKAVKGMLPRNRLGEQIFGNLFVYAGPNHPHAAQQPQLLKF